MLDSIKLKEYFKTLTDEQVRDEVEEVSLLLHRFHGPRIAKIRGRKTAETAEKVAIASGKCLLIVGAFVGLGFLAGGAFPMAMGVKGAVFAGHSVEEALRQAGKRNLEDLDDNEYYAVYKALESKVRLAEREFTFRSVRRQGRKIWEELKASARHLLD